MFQPTGSKQVTRGAVSRRTKKKFSRPAEDKKKAADKQTLKVERVDEYIQLLHFHRTAAAGEKMCGRPIDGTRIVNRLTPFHDNDAVDVKKQKLPHNENKSIERKTSERVIVMCVELPR